MGVDDDEDEDGDEYADEEEGVVVGPNPEPVLPGGRGISHPGSTIGRLGG
jgi:hypothetical protein